MLTSIRMSRFRGFRDTKVSVSQNTVLVGPNSCGKTSVLHAVGLATQALRMALDSGSPARPDSTGTLVVCTDVLLVDHRPLVNLSNWEALFLDRNTGENTRLEVCLAFEASDPIQSIRVSLKCARNNQVKYSVYVQSTDALQQVVGIPNKSKHRGRLLREYLERLVPLTVLIPAFYGVVGQEEYRTRASIEALMASGDQAHIVRNLVVRLDASTRTRLNAFLARTVQAEIVDCTAVGDVDDVRHLAVRFRDSNGALDITAAGAGLINLIALYAALERVRANRRGDQPIILLMDEPEAHLHPQLQGDVGVALVEIAGEFGAQLIIATHAVEMVNRLGTREDVRLVRVDRQSNTATTLSSQQDIVSDLGEWADLSPFAAINFLASRRILFHEGPTDAVVLRACASLLFRNDDTKRRRFERWTLVSLNGVGNLRPTQVIRSLLRPELFPRLGAGDPLRLLWLLDRDHTRTPGMVDVDTEDVQTDAQQRVWSQHSIESLFLEPGLLAGWLSASLPTADKAALVRQIEVALTAADTNDKLNEAAIETRVTNRVQQLMRDGEAGEVNLKNAQRQCRADVLASPAIWQQGKARAKAVLGAVRDELPPAQATRLRGSIAGILMHADAGRLGAPSALIPAELVSVLEWMVRT